MCKELLSAPQGAMHGNEGKHMKRKLTVMIAVAAFAVFALGGAAVASAAGGFGGGSGSSERLDRVAEILGIESSELQSAMQQARSEAAAERLAERLAEAVEDEVLTQEEADAIQAWFDGKPEALESLTRDQHRDMRDANRLGLLAEFLAGLVEDEVLTQVEADEIGTWIEARPTELLEQIRPERGHGRGHHRFRGHGRGFGGGMPGLEAPSEESADTSETAATSNPV